jgi:hypothetical protein
MTTDQVTGCPTSAADLWPSLDAEFRSAALAMAGAVSPRVFGGVPGSTIAWFPGRPFVMDVGHYHELTRVTNRLARLVLQACRRRAGTVGELADALDMDPAQLPLLDRPAPLGDDLLVSIRPDAVYHRGVPKYLELNIDGAVGAVPHVDLVGGRFLREYRRAGLGRELRGADGAVESRFAALSGWLGGQAGRRLVIPVFPVGALPGLGEDLDRFMSWLSPWREIGRRHGLDTVIVPLEALRLTAGGRLAAAGAPVDAVLRLFLYNAQPPSAGTEAFAEAVLGRRVAMYTPEAACLLMNKRTLAWLWSDLDLLTEPDQRLVTRHVPVTVCLPAGAAPDDPRLREARARRVDLVLKPGHGGNGDGVVVGPVVSQQAWEAALDGAVARGGYVLQDYVEPDTTPMQFVHRDTGDRCAADVPFVAGPYVFAGRPSGILIRHGGPPGASRGGGGAVLNAGRGALLSTALLIGRPG